MNFDWSIYLQLSPDGQHTYLQTILNGVVWTLATALSAWIIALLFGTIIGTIRTTPMTWAVRVGNAYVELFRNIPLLVQMFLWFFVLPELLPTAAGDWLKQLPNASFVTAVVCLGFFTSAPGGRTNTGWYPRVTTGTTPGRDGIGTHFAANLSLCPLTHGVPDCYSATHLRIP